MSLFDRINAFRQFLENLYADLGDEFSFAFQKGPASKIKTARVTWNVGAASIDAVGDSGVLISENVVFRLERRLKPGRADNVEDLLKMRDDFILALGQNDFRPTEIAELDLSEEHVIRCEITAGVV